MRSGEDLHGEGRGGGQSVEAGEEVERDVGATRGRLLGVREADGGAQDGA